MYRAGNISHTSQDQPVKCIEIIDVSVCLGDGGGINFWVALKCVNKPTVKVIVNQIETLLLVHSAIESDPF